MAAYEEALNLAVHGHMEEAKAALVSLLEEPLIHNASSAPCVSLYGAGGVAHPPVPHAAGPKAGPSPAFLQLKYLSLKNLGALEGDNHEEVWSVTTAAWVLMCLATRCNYAHRQGAIRHLVLSAASKT